MHSHPLKSCVKLWQHIYQESDTQQPRPRSYFCCSLKSAHNGKVLFAVRAGLAAVDVTESPAHYQVIPSVQQAGAGERGVLIH